ncbi:transcriptional regulator [Streptomyces carpaticus]|uniref:Transcriptional regulator n=1 Tax=Streptomyces carpaticus TaxID=285558 RepID=A0ABV4ZGX4_9ACTN
MPETPSAEFNDRQHVLAGVLRDMIPNAVRIRVHFQHPKRSWPHPHARAYDASDALIALTRVQSLTAARWILRAHPDHVSWDEVYDFDLVTARLVSVTSPVTGEDG